MLVTCAILGSVATNLWAASDHDPLLVELRGGSFESVLPPSATVKTVNVEPFLLDRTPVTNAQFARFVQQRPEWRRDRTARVFADEGYLSHWQSHTTPGSAIQQQPVVRVSWFAASAFCEARGARLPTWHEWEYAAAASETRGDARADAQWQQRILSGYSQSSRAGVRDVGITPRNFYGIQDLHGLTWEWVDDIGALLVSGDARQQSEPDVLRFCGPGALNMEQKENYATLMRIAMLSSTQARYTGTTLGFRCAKDVKTAP